MHINDVAKNNTRPVDITLLVCTYNRCNDLRELLETAVAEETNALFTYEIVVVDNNSSDDTRSVVRDFIENGHDQIRYIFEGRQGKSFALNTGLDAASGRYYAIVDDDFILPNDWAREIFLAFQAHPEVSIVSGKVLPLWQGEPPSWLTKDHWSAIAMADYGDEEFFVDHSNQICLLACSFRTDHVRELGGYNQKLGVTKNQIGSTEDLDILTRLWNSGGSGIYIPHLWFHHKITLERATKAYHRRWHTEHGMFYATMREEEFENSSARLFDVPLHLYRQTAVAAARMFKFLITARPEEAFAEETQVRFAFGFVRTRYAEIRDNGTLNLGGEFAGLMRRLLKRGGEATPKR